MWLLCRRDCFPRVDVHVAMAFKKLSWVSLFMQPTLCTHYVSLSSIKRCTQLAASLFQSWFQALKTWVNFRTFNDPDCNQHPSSLNISQVSFSLPLRFSLDKDKPTFVVCSDPLGSGELIRAISSSCTLNFLPADRLMLLLVNHTFKLKISILNGMGGGGGG